MSRTLTTLRSAGSSFSRSSRSQQSLQSISFAVRRRGYADSTGSAAAGSSTADLSPEELRSKLQELEGLKAEAEKKATEQEAKAKELQNDLLYHKAEIQTLSRRVTEERAKASEFAITSFARSLIGTSDILTQALKHVPKPLEPNSPLESLHNGVELTQKAMYKTFQEAGVVPMNLTRGTVFDPNLHEATFQIPKEVAGPKDDGKEWGPGEVVEIAKDGWMIGNRVLRPAQVGVTQIE